MDVIDPVAVILYYLQIIPAGKHKMTGIQKQITAAPVWPISRSSSASVSTAVPI